jgi:succinoglycan biosynthesis transport protein ExoP
MTTPRDHRSGNGGESPSLLEYLHVLSRRKAVFIATCLLVPIVAVLLSLRQQPIYESSADVLLTPPSAGVVGGIPQGSVDPSRFAETQMLLARVPDVLERALKEVDGTDLTVEDFRKNSSVTQAVGSDLLTFAVKSSEPRLAMDLATGYARAFSEYKAEQDSKRYSERLDEVRSTMSELEAAGDTKSLRYKTLVGNEVELESIIASPDPSATLVREATKTDKVAPRTVRNGGIALVLGIMLAFGAAFLAEALDTRVRSASTVRDALGIPVLGQLPPPPKNLAKEGKLVMLAAPTSPEAEAFRTLRANLAFANAHHKARVLMVTSALDEEGKSTTVANLALALARGGRNVVLIDADLRSPRLHDLFDQPGKPGLTDLELGDVELDEALREIQTLETNERGGRAGTLQLLPAGDALHDPDELGAEAAIARVLREVRPRADVVLVDAAPLLRVGDAVALSAHVDALLVVVHLQSLRSTILDELERTLAATPTTKLGVIVTGAPGTSGLTYRRYGPPPPETPVAQVPVPKNGAQAQNGSPSVRQRVRRWT